MEQKKALLFRIIDNIIEKCFKPEIQVELELIRRSDVQNIRASMQDTRKSQSE